MEEQAIEQMEKVQSNAKQELAKRELAKRRLIDFVKYNFPGYQVNWHHKILAEKLEAVERGEIKRLIVMMPPRHGKSELGSIQFPSWFIGRNPTKEIIAVSYSSELATDFGRKTRNLVRTSESKDIFDTTLAEDSKSVGKWHTEQGGSYIAVGVGGAITGKGADILLIDDPIKNREDAESDIVRAKQWSWYTSTAYTRLSPTGAVVLILTHWHDADLAGRLLDDEDGDEWEVIKFPALATDDEKYRTKGEPLWPTRYTLKKLLNVKRVIGSYDWASLYQQDPIDPELQEFKQEWFRSRSWEEVEKLNTRNFLTVDTAISQKASADYTAMVMNFVDTENKWNIRTWRGRISPGFLINMLFDLQKQYNFEKIGIEKGIYLDSIKEFLEEEMRKRNIFLRIEELFHQNTKKEIRIRGLIPRYENNSVYHIEGQTKDLEDELIRFPKSTHDDLSDALAYQLQIAERPYADDFVPGSQDFGLYKADYA